MHLTDLHDPLAMTLVSSHRTSEGVVSYLRCSCGAWEVRAGGTGGMVGMVGAARPGRLDRRSVTTID